MPKGSSSGSVSKVEMPTPMALICKALFPSISTFETPPWGQTSRNNGPGGSQAADEAARARGGPAQPAACRDTTPHHVTFVEVAPGVRLEVLDWGGVYQPHTMVL